MPCSSCASIERRWFGGMNPFALDAIELCVVANATSPRLREHNFASPLHRGTAALPADVASVVTPATRASTQATLRHISPLASGQVAGGSVPAAVSNDVDA